MSKLFELITGKSVLIFDVDDILLFRLLRNPSDLFLCLEQCSKIPGFFESRMNTQQYFLNNGDCDEGGIVDLDFIYEKMHHNYQTVKEKEINLEVLTTKANPNIKPLFDEAIRNNIPIYLCENLSLPRERIEDLLDKSGFGAYSKLYFSLSGEAREAMYQEIMEETSVPPSEILHIRSSADCHEAKKLGISIFAFESLFRCNGQNLNSSYFAVLNKYRKDDIMIPLLQSNIALYDACGRAKDDWGNFGYKYIGILAFEFAKYIGNIAKGLDIKKIFFSSENGYCLKSVFEVLFPEIESEIIICANRTLTLSMIHQECDLATILLSNIRAETTFRSWITWLCPACQGDFYQAYTTMFPDQNRAISSNEHFAQLRCFITENKQFILDEAVKQKENLNTYLNSLGIFSVSAAVVDVGKNMDLLSGLKAFCHNLPMEHDLTAFWWEYIPVIRWNSGLIGQIKIDENKNRNTVTTNDYLDRVLALALSEPNERVVDLRKSNGSISAISVHKNSQEDQRISISHKILLGAMDCVRDLCEIDKEFSFPLHQGGAMAVCEYLQEHIDQRDKAQLEQVLFTSNPYNWSEARPLFRQKKPVIGIVNPWPEDVSAEAEVITRLKRTADENQVGCVLLDSFGHILKDNQEPTKQFVKEENLSFIITTHYECTKVLNVFYYNPLWNPPEIPLNLRDYTPRVTNQFMMNDDFLIYDDGGMSNHLRAVLMNCPRTLEGAAPLTASFPISAALSPKLDKPVMFYCGMNWEIMFAGPGRHEGLFKLLDDTRKVKFYGPERVEAWGGLKPWEGYHCYQGMIPFDGFSILDKINACGICLVLSSDTHRRAGAATNRLYEACAAGAVIISDDNEFVLQHFHDAALFIKYNKKDPIDTFHQIMEKYDWIVKHPTEALQLARHAQEIFLKEYSLDAQLKQIIANHPARLKQLSQDLYAQSQEGKVLVTFVMDTQSSKTAKERLEAVIKNLHGQVYQNLEFAIAVDQTLAAEITDYCHTRCACAHVVSMELFDKKGIRILTDGEAVRKLQKRISHDYYINTTAEEVWFQDHITSLVRAVTEQDCLGAYSGTAFEHADGCRRVNFFDKLNTSHLYHMSSPNHPLVAGQFLFRADAHNLLPDYLFGNLDGKEHIAYAGITHYRHGAKLAFTKRMSLYFSDKAEDKRCAILSGIMQYRFIRDLLRFYIPEQVMPVQEVNLDSKAALNKKTMAEMLLFVPVKAYIRLRYYRFRMRRKRPGSEGYKMYAAKYEACLEQYRQYWNV